MCLFFKRTIGAFADLNWIVFTHLSSRKMPFEKSFGLQQTYTSFKCPEISLFHPFKLSLLHLVRDREFRASFNVESWGEGA